MFSKYLSKEIGSLPELFLFLQHDLQTKLMAILSVLDA
jgi:hypothetical protein